MDRIIKGVLFDGFARVALIDVTGIANEEIAIHGLSPLACAALGRSMAMGAYIGSNLKSDEDSFSVIINGGGDLGGIVVVGSRNSIRGYVNNPVVELPLKSDGHLDVGGGVGKNGFFTVIKDLGLKEPYVGKCELSNGEIAEDFVKYLWESEGIRSAAALGVKVNSDGCITAGGIVCEALPGINEDMLTILEDVMSNFKNVSDIMQVKSIEEIYDFYFAHLNAVKYDAENVALKCNCSAERIENLIRGLGRDECQVILSEQGKIEAVCHFCNKKYTYYQEDAEKLWDK